MPGDTEMPPQPAWLVGGKRGADESPVIGAKSLKSGEKGKWKGKGKGRQHSDEHPAAEWSSQGEWQAGSGSDHWGWDGHGGEWEDGEGEAADDSRTTGGSGGGRRPPSGRNRPQRGDQVDLNGVIISMHKLTLRSAAELRNTKHNLEDFWLIPTNCPTAKAGIAGGKHNRHSNRSRCFVNTHTLAFFPSIRPG